MGTKAAMGEVGARPGECSACRALSRRTTSAASVVLPEPGMPPTPIRRRWEGRSDWALAGVGS